jgi:hypothetical protein
VQAPLPDEAVSLPMPQATHAPADSDPQASAVHDQIVAALDAEGFPALVPPIDDPDQGVAPEMELAAKCLNPPDPSDTRACTARSERSNGGLVVVLGDSVALSWLPGIRAALVPQGYAVHAVTFSNCPPALVDVELDSESWTRACASGLADALDQVDRLRPDLVIGSSFQNALDLVVARSSNLDARASYIQGLVDVSERVGAAGARFVLLGPPPAGPSPLDCGGRFQHPSDCVTSPRGNFEATLSAFASAAAQGQFGFIDTAPWFCDGSACPGFAGGRLIRWDNAHLTEQFAQYLAPILRSALLREIDAGSMTPTP